MRKRDKFYITTTLPYVNADPHVGHALEFVQSDIIARYRRLKGDEVFFNTGTDEHGMKIYQKAKEAGLEPKKYTDKYAKRYEKIIKELNLSEHNFIRTTDLGHVKAAQEFWRVCDKNDDIYKKEYKIKYCVGCELEKTDSELSHGRCPLHLSLEIEIIEEENYFFKFSKYQDKLLKLYKKHPDFVLPKTRLNEINSFVERGLQDFSISRLKEKMPWGIEVPGDSRHVMYVWFDALVNYISAIGWPEDIKKFKSWWPVTQTAGKDNLRQQCAMWQAMLMSAGIEPSRQILIHGFISSGGQKMSKSLGNVIDPFEIIKKYGADSFRYYLAREISTFEDGDFTSKRMEEIYKSDLAEGIGNTLSRVLAMVEKYSNGTVPKVEMEPHKKAKGFWIAYHAEMKNYKFYLVLKVIQTLITWCDVSISENKPWILAKEGKQKELETHLYKYLETLRFVANALYPFMPETADKILLQLGIDPVKEKVKSQESREKWGGLKPGTKINKEGVLFSKL